MEKMLFFIINVGVYVSSWIIVKAEICIIKLPNKDNLESYSQSLKSLLGLFKWHLLWTMSMIKRFCIEILKHKISSLPQKEILKLEILVLLEFFNILMIVLIQPLEHHIISLHKFVNRSLIIKSRIFGV